MGHRNAMGPKALHPDGQAPDMRGKLETDTLLKIILLLVAIWLVLAIVSATLDVLGSMFGFLPNLLGLAIILLIVLWLLDYI